MADKDLNQCCISFVPTAANVENNTEWVKEDIENLRSAAGVREIVMADIEKLPKHNLLSIIKQSDVICFGGGNTYHLLYWVRKSGLQDELEELLKSRLYVGISAGSIVVGPDISINGDVFPKEEGYFLDDLTGLQYVPFAIKPHYFSKHFPKLRPQEIQQFSQQVNYPIYAIDDNTAIKVIANKVEIISEGKWEKYN